jgi:hypothetical protein
MRRPGMPPTGSRRWKGLGMKVRAVVMLFAVMIGMNGCVETTAPRPCEQISQTAIRSIIQDPTSVERARQRVVVSFGIPPADVSIHPLTEGEPPAEIKALPLEQGSDIDWQHDGVKYEMVIEGTQVAAVRATYESNAPSGSALIQCLDAPGKYFARHYPGAAGTRRLAELTLFFPAIGADCRIDKYSADDPPHFDANDPIAACDFVPVSQPDQVISRLVKELAALNAAVWMEGQLKPWLGDWQNIVVETKPLP